MEVVLFEDSIFTPNLPSKGAWNWLVRTFLSQTKECGAENNECAAENNFNIALHYIILTLTILNEFNVTFPHSSSDRKKQEEKINGKEEICKEEAPKTITS